MIVFSRNRNKIHLTQSSQFGGKIYKRIYVYILYFPSFQFNHPLQYLFLSVWLLFSIELCQYFKKHCVLAFGSLIPFLRANCFNFIIAPRHSQVHWNCSIYLSSLKKKKKCIPLNIFMFQTMPLQYLLSLSAPDYTPC